MLTVQWLINQIKNSAFTLELGRVIRLSCYAVQSFEVKRRVKGDRQYFLV